MINIVNKQNNTKLINGAKSNLTKLNSNNIKTIK